MFLIREDFETENSQESCETSSEDGEEEPVYYDEDDQNVENQQDASLFETPKPKKTKKKNGRDSDDNFTIKEESGEGSSHRMT